MKRAFTLCVEDGVKVVGLQIGVAVQRESDGEKGVTFFSLSDDIRENDEWLFKVNGIAERIAIGEPTGAEPRESERRV
jgi:hypothetical protein